MIRPQGLEHVRVAVHRGVAVASQRPAGVEYDAAVVSDERRPRLLPGGVVRRIEKARERRRRAGLLPAVVGRGVRTSVG
jgi:hypothetical protein